MFRMTFERSQMCFRH